MITYQDFQEVGRSEAERIEFCRSAIQAHKAGDDYLIAAEAAEYDRRRNPTIRAYQRMIYTATGEMRPDTSGTGFKLVSADFPFLVEQRVQYLLGNGASFTDPETSKRLGSGFDSKLQEAAHIALVEKSAFGFWNLDHMDVFAYTEFVPFYDEETGALRAGIRFWQLDYDKPLRAVLYEEDGYTGYIWGESSARVHSPKRHYIQRIVKPSEDEDEQRTGENYGAFPIVTLWGNKQCQSEIVGLQEKIDCYDLLASGYAESVEEASYIYWAIQNAAGMDDEDLLDFVDKMRKIHAAVVEDSGARAEAHSVEAPYAAREAVLTRLKRDIYTDFGGVDPEHIASGVATATEIRAAYERLDQKANGLEYCVIDFVKGILSVAGIEDDPTFTRSMIVNAGEMIQLVLQAAQYLDEEYVTRKILTLLGDGDQADAVLERMAADELKRGGLGSESPDDDEDDNGAEAPDSVDVGEALEEAEEMAGKGLNGSQTQSLITVIKNYVQGVLTESQAVNIVSAAIGITKDEARSIINGVE